MNPATSAAADLAAMAARFPPVDIDATVDALAGLVAAYAAVPPLVSGALILAVVVAVCFLLATATGNYSQVDRIWSITPILYAWNFVAVASLRGMPLDARLTTMAVLITVWGARLTYNFWRKGGYNWHDEDYRWPKLRTIITNPVLWHTFAFLFISLYQNLLLFLLVCPMQPVFASASAGAAAVPWTRTDSAAAVLFVALLALETATDQQQWEFQSKKWALLREGRTLESLPVPLRFGFPTTGLFRLCRHPNFFAEFSINWTAIGAVLLTTLFFGSTAFTEYITSAKYPLYKLYQKHTPALVPFFPDVPFEEIVRKEGGPYLTSGATPTKRKTQ
ncbi:hypothetical protein HK405_012824 [Cladochytrium tenue]|nr:hypothetical protein HK405_012824 [Cladochytrium tenue]